MNPTDSTGQAVELIRLNVSPEQQSNFLTGRRKVDAFTSTLPGFISTELLQLTDTEWLMLIRWDNLASARAAQVQTANATVISDWLAHTSTFISFDTASVQYSHHPSSL